MEDDIEDIQVSSTLGSEGWWSPVLTKFDLVDIVLYGECIDKIKVCRFQKRLWSEHPLTPVLTYKLNLDIKLFAAVNF